MHIKFGHIFGFQTFVTLNTDDDIRSLIKFTPFMQLFIGNLLQLSDL